MLRRLMMAGGGVAPPNDWQIAVAALNPLVWLTLSEASGSFLDVSGNGYHGTPNNSPTRTRPALFANTGACAGFGGANQSVSIGDAAPLRRSGDVTIAVILNRNGAQGAGFPKLFWKPTDYANGRCNYGLIYEGSTNKVFFRVNAASAYYTATSATTFANATHYLVVGRRSGSEVSIWVNGVKEGTATLPSSGTALDTNNGAVWIGGQTSSINDQFTGDLDEPIIFDYALSDADIAALWAARERDPNFASVSALLHMDGANNSTTFTDVTGKTWTRAGDAKISTAQSRFGNASGNFDGAGDNISAAASADFGFGSGDFTVEGFAYQAGATGAFCAFDNRTSGAAGFAVYIGSGTGSGSQRLSYFDNTAAIQIISGTALPVNQMFHWAVTRAGTTVRLFQNGVQVGSGTDSRTLATSVAPFIGSAWNNSQNFAGWIDEVRITKGVARYTANFTPPRSPFPDS